MSIVDEIISVRTPQPRFPVLSSMKKRFSPHIFSKEPISEESIRSIFEAARLTPSARNYQPWYFYFARQGTKSYEQLASSLVEANTWALTAPILILACYNPTEGDGSNKWAMYDLGQAVMSLVLQAQEIGIFCRQMGLFDVDVVTNLLKIPDPYIPFVIIAAGKLGTEKDYQAANPVFAKKDLSEVTRKETIVTELT